VFELPNMLSTGLQSLQIPFSFSKIHVKQHRVSQDRCCQQIMFSLKSPGMTDCASQHEGQG